jgi:glycogen debranching enzyme
MLAGLCSTEQAQKLVKNLEDPQCFGGSMPWVSIARNDPWFHPKGNYWRGGIWVPLAYMGTKALERYGFYELADQTAYNLLEHIRNTYNEFEPHTIWEVYSPTEAKPATNKTDKNFCRPNFCGWSALAPISMLIENVLGFHHVNSITRTINWRLYQSQRHGLRQFRFGTICTDIVYEDGSVSVKSNEPFTLIINSQSTE